MDQDLTIERDGALDSTHAAAPVGKVCLEEELFHEQF